MPTPIFAIALYIPESTDLALNSGGVTRGLLDGTELDFIRPGWWETSRTSRLFVVPPEDLASDEAEGCG